MDSLQINSGIIELCINNDASRVIRFNPADVLFAERFYNLIGDFQSTLMHYQSKILELEKVTETDENDVPLNAGERLEVIKDVSGYIRKQIDALFGAGTSQTVFGDSLSLDAFQQFFEGITPYIQKARASKVAKYAKKVK